MERIQSEKLQLALEKHNPNKQIHPLDMLHNYDKVGAIEPSPYGNNNYNSGLPSAYNNGMNGSFYNNN